MASVGGDSLVNNEWMITLFTSLGTSLIMFTLGKVWNGLAELKKEINSLGQRISKLEGKMNVSP